MYKLVELSKLCDIQIGKTPDRKISEYWGVGFPWVSISDLKSKVVTTTKEQITKNAVEEKNCKLVKKGTLLMSFKLSIGKLAFAGCDLYTNEAIVALNIKEEVELSKDYLYYALNFVPLLNDARIAVKGKTLNQKSLNKIKIPLLDTLEEQRRIANLLSKIENLLEKREKSIELLDSLAKSTFLDMFGSPVSNNKWALVPLSKMGEINRGISKHRPRNAPELLGGKYPLIQTGDVANSGLYLESYSRTYSELGLEQSKLWEKDTLCITIAANIAKTAILKFDACFPDSIVGMKVNKKNTNNIYMYYIFDSLQKILEKNAPAAAQKNINLEILRKLKIPMPPKDLQEKFADIILKIENTKKIYENSLNELKQLFNATSQKAFKGELELSYPTGLVEEIKKTNFQLDLGTSEDKEDNDKDSIVDLNSNKYGGNNPFYNILNNGLIIDNSIVLDTEQIHDFIRFYNENSDKKEQIDITKDKFLNSHQMPIPFFKLNENFIKSLIKTMVNIKNIDLINIIKGFNFEKELKFIDIKNMLLELLENDEIEQFFHTYETLDGIKYTIAFRIKE